MEALILKGKIKELTPSDGQPCEAAWDYPAILHEPPAYLLS
jgi:hypothetical protein